MFFMKASTIRNIAVARYFGRWFMRAI